MLVFQRSTESHPMPLTKGLVTAFSVATVYVAMFAAGILIGDMLRIESPTAPELYSKTNSYIALGLFIVVIVKLLLPYLRREPQLPVFDISKWSGIFAMAVATGINILLAGIGSGFVTTTAGHWHRIVWPMLAATILLGYWGIMLGRQKIKIRPRHWAIVASILLLGVAIATIINA